MGAYILRRLLLIIPTLPYKENELRHILHVRCEEEDVEMADAPSSSKKEKKKKKRKEASGDVELIKAKKKKKKKSSA